MLAVSILPHKATALQELFTFIKTQLFTMALTSSKRITFSLVDNDICNRLVQWTSVVMVSVLLLASYVSGFLFVWVSWVYLAKVKNFKDEKETIAIAKTSGHWKNRKVIESLPLDWSIKVHGKWTEDKVNLNPNSNPKP